MIKGFTINTSRGETIRFFYYLSEAPQTCNAFNAQLPFDNSFMHARTSGQEVWIDNAPLLNIPQENASVFTEPGEVVIGPQYPARVKTAGCMGIYYGEGKGLDACNIFAKVASEDKTLLKTLGERIWKEGMEKLRFEAMI